jgi:hypothetical protein
VSGDRPPVDLYAPDYVQPLHDLVDAVERIADLLTEIRDRLPARPGPVESVTPTLVGYRQGQAMPPSRGQVAMARRVLAGEFTEVGEVEHSIMRAIATEVVRRAEDMA